MKKFLGLWIALATLLLSFTAWGYTPPPAPTDGYLLDQAGLLSAEEATRVRQKLAHIEANSKNEIAVLILPRLDGETIDDVAYKTFNSWGIGKKGEDNGVLLVVSVEDRKSRIETGKGVGGELTDLQSKEILDKNLKPHFQKAQYGNGIESAVDAISSTLESRADVKTEPEKKGMSGWTIALIVFGIFLYILIAALTRNPFWGLELVFALALSGKGGGGRSGGSSFGGGSSGGGGASSDW